MNRGPDYVKCETCGLRKKPIGRDASPYWYGCDSDCPGYMQDPRPSCLWPGEEEDPGCLELEDRFKGEAND